MLGAGTTVKFTPLLGWLDTVTTTFPVVAPLGTVTAILDAPHDVTVPSGATTGNVVVTVSSQPSNGVNFTVVPAPSIASLSVTTGAVGAAVTVTGSNFGSSQGAGTVTFNGTTATVTSWGALSIGV